MNALMVLLMVYAACSKFLGRHDFTAQLSLHFSHGVSQLITWATPLTELITAILLTIHGTRKAGTLLFLLLMLVFTLYIVVLLLKGGNLPCSCGGVISSLSWRQHLWFNAAFIMAGFVSLQYQLKQKPATNY